MFVYQNMFVLELKEDQDTEYVIYWLEIKRGVYF